MALSRIDRSKEHRRREKEIQFVRLSLSELTQILTLHRKKYDTFECTNNDDVADSVEDVEQNPTLFAGNPSFKLGELWLQFEPHKVALVLNGPKPTDKTLVLRDSIFNELRLHRSRLLVYLHHSYQFCSALTWLAIVFFAILFFAQNINFTTQKGDDLLSNEYLWGIFFTVAAIGNSVFKKNILDRASVKYRLKESWWQRNSDHYVSMGFGSVLTVVTGFLVWLLIKWFE